VYWVRNLCWKNLNHNYLVIAEVVKSHIIKIYRNDDHFCNTTKDITVYEISPSFKKQFFVTLIAERVDPLKAFGLPLVINTNDSSYPSISKGFSRVFAKFLDFNEDEIDLIELRIDSSLISYHILWPEDKQVCDYKSEDNYDLPTNTIIMAKIPIEFQQRYRSERINEISFDSKESKFPKYPSIQNISLYDCLDQYLTIEELSDKMLCDYCYSSQTPTKRLEIVKAPEVLLLQLKRSRSSSRGNSYIDYYSSRNSHFVDFPIELSLDNYVSAKEQINESLLYDLIAVSNHSGSNFGGHYTTYAKNYLNSKWYCFNDSYVCEISDKQLVTQNAYLLVYLKRKQ